MIKTGRKFKCIDNLDRELDLTVGKVYSELQVAGAPLSLVYLRGDRGVTFGFADNRFVRLPGGTVAEADRSRVDAGPTWAFR